MDSCDENTRLRVPDAVAADAVDAVDAADAVDTVVAVDAVAVLGVAAARGALLSLVCNTLEEDRLSSTGGVPGL